MGKPVIGLSGSRLNNGAVFLLFGIKDNISVDNRTVFKIANHSKTFDYSSKVVSIDIMVIDLNDILNKTLTINLKEDRRTNGYKHYFIMDKKLVNV